MSLRQPTSKTDLRGLMFPAPQVLGATLAATSQAGPRPGTLTPATTSMGTLALEASGTLDAAVDPIEVQAIDGGAVGDAAIRWRYAGDTLWYQYDPPALCTGWEYIDRSTTSLAWTASNPVRFPSSGRVVVGVTSETNTAAVAVQGARGTWSLVDVEDTGAATVSALVPLSNGRLIDVYAYKVAAAVTQLRMSYSDDGGATWDLGSPRCLSTPLAVASSAVKRIRAVELNGVVCLVVWFSDGSSDQVWQYTSGDGGCHFTELDRTSTAGEAAPDLKVREGVIYLATVKRDATRTYAYHTPILRRITSAGQKFSTVDPVSAVSDVAGNLTEWGTYAAGLFTSAELALLVEDNGDLWLFGSDHDSTATREIATRHSTDGGDTWAQHGVSGTPVPLGTVLHWAGTGTEYLKDFAVCMERGRAVFTHRFASSSGSAQDSLCAMYLGRWSTVGMPEDTSSDRRAGVVGHEVLYLAALSDPDVAGSVWTKTSAGSPTSTGGSQGRTFASTNPDYQYWTASPSLTTPDKGMHFEQELSVSSGTWTAELRISDGANDFTCSARVTATSIELWDDRAAARVGSSVVIDATKTIHVKLVIDKGTGAWASNVGRARLWYRISGPYTGLLPHGPDAVQEWIQVASTTSLQAGAGTASRIRVGVLSAMTSSVVARWWAYTPAPYVADNITTSESGQARGYVVPPETTPVHLAEGLRVYGTGGLCVAGDTWTHTTDYEHPVEAVLPTLAGDSPKRAWRSNGDTIDQEITFTGVDWGWRSGDLLGVHVVRTNVKTMSVWRDTTGTNKVMDIDMSKETAGLAYTRSKDLIYPKAGGSNAGFHFRERSLVDAHVDLGGGVIRKVRTNDGGAWLATGAAGTYPSARLWLDSFEAGDPTGAATLDLWMPQGLFLTEAMASAADLMIRIPAQATAEDYFELKVVIGRFRVLAHQWGRGWSLVWAPLYELTTGKGGGRRGRRLGSPARAIEVAWEDPVDTFGTSEKGKAPDHLTLGYGGADALAAYADTPHTLAGAFLEAGGAVVPGTLCRAFPQQSAATTSTTPISILDPEAFLYGRFMSESVRWDNVIGNELQAPLGRMPVLRFEEER